MGVRGRGIVGTRHRVGELVRRRPLGQGPRGTPGRGHPTRSRTPDPAPGREIDIPPARVRDRAPAEIDRSRRRYVQLDPGGVRHPGATGRGFPHRAPVPPCYVSRFEPWSGRGDDSRFDFGLPIGGTSRARPHRRGQEIVERFDVVGFEGCRHVGTRDSEHHPGNILSGGPVDRSGRAIDAEQIDHLGHTVWTQRPKRNHVSVWVAHLF